MTSLSHFQLQQLATGTLYSAIDPNSIAGQVVSMLKFMALGGAFGPAASMLALGPGIAPPLATYGLSSLASILRTNHVASSVLGLSSSLVPAAQLQHHSMRLLRVRVWAYTIGSACMWVLGTRPARELEAMLERVLRDIWALEVREMLRDWLRAVLQKVSRSVEGFMAVWRELERALGWGMNAVAVVALEQEVSVAESRAADLDNVNECRAESSQHEDFTSSTLPSSDSGPVSADWEMVPVAEPLHEGWDAVSSAECFQPQEQWVIVLEPPQQCSVDREVDELENWCRK
ncbi:hypothetical protein BU24DRAFT_407344 [Aaosphaeria arxii CBS 175.79]|uniref:Uncharacterized protein n=1 Tax=Aaosphaeria arxii CBS 175.79 TaxID=1450172 RepID=A0A6A5XVT7_9PLEO|nr:uncharacterized protein BU24DRAFT_407344 [Aaosphaeria arxii CBS 175.79]KAF2017302.1 hypothetical protein BU24DRAFT_407344 [Aaosphaeria arxii CBS 175.79]